jgi:hypothetical protein
MDGGIDSSKNENCILLWIERVQNNVKKIVVWCTMGYHIKFGGVITLAQAYGKIISL